ncbi:MAG: nitroreductase family protein [Bacilli bacterium]|nr:nitroreductase family protein [Bacilli bacterium]
MDALECISGRMSMRKFAPHEMSQEEIHAILKAGMEAPSAMNRRPYELIVNTDNAFWVEMKKEKPTCEIIATSSLSIVVVGDENKNPTHEFLIEDCSVVAENMLLAAKALGYDSLWAGVKFDSEFYLSLIDRFNLPNGFMPIAVLCFGKAGSNKTQVDRYEEKKVHWGKF